MIKIKNLKAQVNSKKILKGVSLDFDIGKNYCLLWQNGSGKSTLSSILMWNPKYEVTEWTVKIWKENLLELSPSYRSKAGLFLSFQNVPEISWIKLSEFLRTIYNIHLKNNKPEVKELSPFIFKRFVKKHLDELNIDEAFLNRDLNVWFSGWEKRKIEILQMKLINPKYIILDEIDSGLDLDAFRDVVKLLEWLNDETNTLIVITHYFKILDYIDMDKIYIMEDWMIIKEGGKELVDTIKSKGYKNL